MKPESHVMTETGDMVLDFIQAMNAEDFDAAREFASDDLKFIGVMGSREGADAYFNDMKKMKFKYEVKKAFADDDDVCLFYDIDMGGITVFSCGWYHIQDGKIDTIRVLFDPRPVLEAQQNK
jgi:limonene-1,2-epoxide hydrolase